LYIISEVAEWPREQLEIEAASIVQANPVDNGNVSVTDVNVNVDDRPDFLFVA